MHIQSSTLTITATLAAIAAASTLVACSATQSNHAGSNNHASEPFRTADSQIAHGVQVYTNNCAKCHGDAGQGTSKAPMLVGEGAFEDYHSALDVAVFETKNMPPKQKRSVPTSEREFWNIKASPKMLDDRDYWAVLAFALSANGVELSQPVGPHNAADIILNP